VKDESPATVIVERVIPPSSDCLVGETWVAVYCDVEPDTLYRWRAEGKGPPFYKIGRYVKYRPREVEEWVESRKRASTAGGLLSFGKRKRKPER
jgi:predicted DNA-binding transcriptional regulator AlpA